MDNQQLSDIVAASWEVLLYPDENLKAVAGDITKSFSSLLK